MFNLLSDLGKTDVLNNSSRLVSPVESPDLYNDIGRILIHAKRPVPECEINEPSGGTAEPVGMNCPNVRL